MDVSGSPPSANRRTCCSDEALGAVDVAGTRARGVRGGAGPEAGRAGVGWWSRSGCPAAGPRLGASRGASLDPRSGHRPRPRRGAAHPGACSRRRGAASARRMALRHRCRWSAWAGRPSSWMAPSVSSRCGSVRAQGDRSRTNTSTPSTRLRSGGGLPGTWTVLLEPVREGRAAASLAREGEGPCAIYVRPVSGLETWLVAAGARGITVGSPRNGPFGRQLLLAGGPAGPHVIVTEGRQPVSGAAAPGTIAP